MIRFSKPTDDKIMFPDGHTRTRVQRALRGLDLLWTGVRVLAEIRDELRGIREAQVARAERRCWQPVPGSVGGDADRCSRLTDHDIGESVEMHRSPSGRTWW